MARIKATVTIQGQRPILFNSFSINSIPLERQERTGIAGNDPEEWKKSVLITSDRTLYIPASYIFGCIRDGGKHIKQGRGSLQPKIASTLVVVDEIILLDRKLPLEKDIKMNELSEPVYLDVRSVKNPATKGRNIRYRIAASPGWKATFTIEWDSSIVSVNQMQAVIKDSGNLVGLGDARSIGYGRFTNPVFKAETS